MCIAVIIKKIWFLFLFLHVSFSFMLNINQIIYFFYYKYFFNVCIMILKNFCTLWERVDDLGNFNVGKMVKVQVTVNMMTFTCLVRSTDLHCINKKTVALKTDLCYVNVIFFSFLKMYFYNILKVYKNKLFLLIIFRQYNVFKSNVRLIKIN